MPDAVGNLFKTRDRSDRVYGAAGQVVEAIDEQGRHVRYDYDVEGNLIAKTGSDGQRWEYRWGSDGLMSSVLRPDGDEVSFAYDALGRRVAKTFRGRTTRWVWDGDVPLHEWVEDTLTPVVGVSVPDASDAIAAQREAALSSLVRRGPPEQGSRTNPITWVFEPDTFTPIARTVAGQIQTAVSDHLGVVIAIFNSAGQSVWQGQPDTWGDHHSPEGDLSRWQFRWPGQYEDSETGLSYNRYRYYDPDTATYTSPDPLGLAGGLRPYAYVTDPLTHIDPHGLVANNAYGKATKSGPEVMLDTSAVVARRGARSLMRPGECPVICSTVSREARAHSFNAAGLPVVTDGSSALLRGRTAQQLRAFGAQAIGFDNDVVIGATALERSSPLVTGDYALANAVAKLGGEVRWLVPGG